MNELRLAAGRRLACAVLFGFFCFSVNGEPEAGAFDFRKVAGGRGNFRYGSDFGRQSRGMKLPLPELMVEEHGGSQARLLSSEIRGWYLFRPFLVGRKMVFGDMSVEGHGSLRSS